MNKALSGAIYYLRIPLAVLVVLLHITPMPSATAWNHFHGDSTGYEVVKVFGFVLAGLAVPVFYIFSGYLLMFKAKKYKIEIKKRAYSLLIPYVVWNILAALYLYLASGENYFSFYDLFVKPANFPLWFLRDLIVLTAIYPLFRWLIERTGYLSLIAAFSLYILFPCNSFFFFFTGCFLGLRKYTFYMPASLLSVASVVSLLLYAGAVYTYNPLGTVHKLWLAAGAFTLVAITTKICFEGSLNPFIIKISGASYFVYLAHKLGPTYLSKLPFELLTKSESVKIIEFLTAPVIATAICVLVYFIAMKYCPKIFSFLTGGKA